MTEPKCWFCDSVTALHPYERSYDGAPYLNEDGSQQMICQECKDDMAAWRRRNIEAFDLAEAVTRMVDAAEGFDD